MSSLTLDLPKSLHDDLLTRAQSEGVPLNQYIVYTLTRKMPPSYVVYSVPPEEVKKQQENFEEYLANTPKATTEEIEAVLAEREQAKPEEAAEPETRAAFETLMAKRKVQNI